MALYDKASLVLIPSGTKEGVCFSQKPTNGDGDFIFTRASSATRVNSDGLIEKETQNLILQSNTFDTTWTTSEGTILGGQTGYDGSSDAWLYTDNVGATSKSHDVRQIVSESGVNCFSIYAKMGTKDWVKMYDGLNTCYFNIDPNYVGNRVGTDGTLGGSIEDVGSGWFRLSVFDNGSTSLVLFGIAGGDGVPNYTSDGTGTVYIQDAQLNQGLVADSYLETTTTAVYEGITDNIPRLDYTDASCPSLLLEPQRTNLCTNSIWAGGVPPISWYVANTNGTITETSSTLGEDSIALEFDNIGGGSINIEYHNVYLASSYVWSFYIESITGLIEYEDLIRLTGGPSISSSSFFLDGVEVLPNAQVEVGKFEYRFTMSVGSAHGTRIGSGSGSSISANTIVLSRPQLEEASYATSYIPTYGASVTRVEDACVKTGVSDLIGQTEGTLFLDFNPLEIDSTSRYLSIESASGAASGWIGIFATSSGLFRLYGDGFDITFGDYSVGDRAKIALTYKNGVATNIYINGVNKGSITANTTSKNYSILKVGDAIIGAIGAGEYKKVLVFPTALSNEELADLTTI